MRISWNRTWKTSHIILLLVCVLVPWRISSRVAGLDLPSLRAVDKIVFFNATSPTYSANLSLAKNQIYRGAYECYMPNAAFNITVRVTAPSGMEYLLWNKTHAPRYDSDAYEFDFGPAETGNHLLTVTVITPANLSLHLSFHPYLSLGRYYENHVQHDFTTLANESLWYYFNDTYAFNSVLNRRVFTLNVENDTEYWVDCFRTNPLTDQQIAALNYSMPMANLILTLQNVDYAVWENQPLREEAFLSNDHFHVKLGFAWSGIAQVEFKISVSNLPLNLAFICYSRQRIGDGPDTNDTIQNNATDNNGTNTFSFFNPMNASWLENWTAQFDGFTSQYLDVILIAGGSLVAVLTGINYYRTNKKTKESQPTEVRE